MGCYSSAQAAQDEDIAYDKAVLQVKVARDRVKKYQNRIEADNEKETKLAIRLAKEGKKDRAKLVLQAKKAREVMLVKADGMLNTLQQQLDKLEQAKLTKSLADSLKQTNGVLEEMNKNLTVEMVEDLMDENAEQADRLKEVADMLGTNLSEQDQEEVEEEYERMLAELNGEGEKEPEQKEDEPEPEQEEEPEPEKPQRIAALA